ncbi:MAG: hypothetical protein KI791_19300, partial [Cyclobacteriaceae bacterium]|nr:hypothetical protein [Cyclobacteriaceae bacterium SS2]
TNTLTLGTVGDAQTIISSAGTTASALDLNATAGGIDIDANSTVAVDAGTGVTIDAAANNIEINAAAGAISLANDANDGAVNIGTGTTNGRTITIGNSTLSSGIVLNTGTGGVTGTGVLDEDNMVSNSDIRLATQQSIKAYVDNQVNSQDLQAAYDDGNTIVTSGGNPLDISGTEAISLDAGGASNFTVDGNNLTLSTITSGTVIVNGVDGVNVVGNGNEIDLTTVGALVDINAGSLEADITNGLSLDAGGASNFNTSGGNSLTLGTLGDAQTIINSAGTSASALDLNATAGGIDIDANSTVAVDAGTGITLDAAANNIEINAVAGAISLANDTDDGAVNIGTGTTNGRTITIGNSTLATGIVLNAGTGGVAGSGVLDEDNMASNSDIRLATQQSIKAYVDTQVGNQDLQAAYDDGNTITATNSGGNVTINLSETSDFVIQDAGAPFITATNTGELDIDNLRIDGNTISSTNANGNILLVPNGTGVVQTSAIDIDGGSITGIIDLAVADGGTGASDAATARTNLGIDIGSDIQAWDQALDDISGLAVTDGNIIVADGTNWIVESGATARTSLGLAIGTDVQAYDAGLNSISGLTTAADQMVYTTASDTYAVTDLTAAGRAILDDANAAAQRTTLGIDIGSDIQAWDQALDDISGLAVTDGNIIVADGTNWIVESGATARTSLGLAIGTDVQAYDADLTTYAGITPSADIQSLLGSADYSTARSNLGLAIGTDVQAYDAGLNSISGLTTAANQMVYTTGSDTYAVTNLTAAGRAILDDANAAAQRTTLGIDIGSDIQAWDQALDDISGLAVTDGNIIVADGTNWIVESGATARTSLGLAIGTDVQAYDADLTTYAGITPSADIQSLLGSADYSTARSNLGLAIGTDVQAYDAGLNSISGLTTAADQMVYTTASDTYAVTDLTAAGRAILDDANAAAQRTTLGLGSLSTLSSIGSSEVTDNSLTTDDLGPGSVNTSEIVDDAVTTDKLGTAGAGDANKTYTTDASGNPQLVTAVGFEAYLGSSQIVNGSVLVQFNTEAFDVNGDFDNSASNYSFTAPVDGLYHFEVQLEVGFVNATGETLSFSLFVNDGSPTEVVRATGIGTVSTNSFNTSKTLQLGAGDEVYVEFNTPGNRTISAGRARSFFSGHLIR